MIDGWRIDYGRSNSGGTLFSPLWPHGGKKDGDILYASASPSYGWRLLIYYGGSSMIQGTTLADVLRSLPDSLADEIWVIHDHIELQAAKEADKWIARRQSYRLERLSLWRQT